MQFICDTCYVSRALSLRLFLPVEMRKGKVKEQFTKYVEIVSGVDVDGVATSLRKSAIKQRDLLYYLEENGKCKVADVNNLFGSSALKGLIEKKIVDITLEKFLRSPYKNLTTDKKSVDLTIKQQNAVKSIIETDKTVSLLYGVFVALLFFI
jgi:primosomal protein N'